MRYSYIVLQYIFIFYISFLFTFICNLTFQMINLTRNFVTWLFWKILKESSCVLDQMCCCSKTTISGPAVLKLNGKVRLLSREFLPYPCNKVGNETDFCRNHYRHCRSLLTKQCLSTQTSRIVPYSIIITNQQIYK